MSQITGVIGTKKSIVKKYEKLALSFAKGEKFDEMFDLLYQAIDHLRDDVEKELSTKSKN